MKRSQLVIAALTFSSVGAIAAANNTSADASTSSSRSYTASMPNDNSQVSQIQQALNDKGFNVGPVDGQMGPKTKAALKQFQQAQGLQASGKLDQQTVAALSIGTSSPSAASEMSNTGTPSSSTPSTTSTPGTTTGASSPNGPATPNSSDTSGFSPQSPPPAQAK
jgi:peptidoglycan hydrolase-like protein with peptidoglycan-binding domain